MVALLEVALLALLAPVVAALHVKVYILAGQSNMEGKGVAVKSAGAYDGNGTVEATINQDTWRALPVCETMEEATDRVGCRAEGASFDGLLGKDGNWSKWEDTRVVFRGSRNKTGPLSIGFGYQDAWIGPEYGFGLGVRESATTALLLKWAWGGTSLNGDWRPPSAGGTVGWCYGNMTSMVHSVLERELEDVVPGYAYGADTYELVGFGWHQGWQDGCGDKGTDEYESNLAHLISDIRKEFDSPALPVAIGLSGFGGWGQSNSRRLGIMKAQYNVSTYLDNVGTVESRGFFREFAETRGAINQGYHWFGNGETYVYLGTAMGRCMNALVAGTWKQPAIDFIPRDDAPRLGECGAYEDGAPCEY